MPLTVLRYTLYPVTSDDVLAVQLKVIAWLAAAIVMLKLAEAVVAGEPESVTFIVKLKVPAVVGVPEIVPVADRVRPPGKAPELMLQLYGVVPPVAASVVEYAVPTCPEETELVVTCTGVTAAATVSVNDFVAVCAVGEVESVTLAVKLNEPDAVGGPEIVPVADRVRPPGKAPELMLQLYGVVPPVAASAVEYAVPTCPEETELVVICTGVTAAVTATLSDFVAVCAGDEESLTWTVKDDVPACVGVPLIWPVEAVRFNPAGRVPELIDHEYGAVPPEALKVAA